MFSYSKNKFLVQILGVGLLLTLTFCEGDKGITTPDEEEETPNDTTSTDKEYKLVWSDEFNYEGTPDIDKWNFEIGDGGWGNNELQYYTDRLENAHVADSVLIITAREENYEGANYTSARMITYKNDHYWQYGRIEARIKLPEGQGIWPAFWMLGKNIFEGTNWPATGEIDILEMIGGGEDDSIVRGAAHWDEDGHTHVGDSFKNSEKLSQNFHNYAIEWNNEKIKWFFNDKQYFSLDIQSSSMDEFNAQLYILLNIAVGGDWPGKPDNTTEFPQTMKVDYVRVYKK